MRTVRERARTVRALMLVDAAFRQRCHAAAAISAAALQRRDMLLMEIAMPQALMIPRSSLVAFAAAERDRYGRW